MFLFEIETQKENEERIYDEMREILNKFDIDDDRIKISSTKKKDCLVYEIRESLPQTINEMVRQRNIKKISTDFAVDDENFYRMMEMYDNILSRTKIRHFVFGHIGMNSLHINFVPENEMQRQEAHELYDPMAKEIAFLDGTISAEV